MMLPNVKFTGFVGGEEKHRLLRECRAVLFPSLWNEPLSTVAYEAYDMEKPVICSDRGGMSEIVVDGITGRLLAPADSQAWKEAISELALDEELARKLGLQSKAWLRENVSWKTWFSNFEMIVSRMASVDG